ncbi:putative RNA 2'-phosphotransferase [Bienertia sinuspersici]
MASSSESRSHSSGKPHVLYFHQDRTPLRLNSYGYFKWVDEEYRVQELQFLVFERDTRITELEILIEEFKNDVKKLKENKLEAGR